MNNNYIYGAFLVFLSFFLWIFVLAIMSLQIISTWKIFVKAKKPGWAALIPIYNTLVLLEILGKPWWFIFLMIFVPVGNFVIAIILMLDLAKVFGKSTAFAIGLIFLSVVFMAILAFGDDRYLGTDVLMHQQS